MWYKAAKLIIKNRVLFLFLIFSLTAFMVYKGKGVKTTYELAKIIPDYHPKAKEFKSFKELFGEDGNIMLLGVQSENIFTLDFFNDWFQMGEDLKSINGIDAVTSVAHASILLKNKAKKRFDIIPLTSKQIDSQEKLDSIKQLFMSLSFYQDLLYKENSKLSVMAVTFDSKKLDSSERFRIMKEINNYLAKFSSVHAVQIRKSGLPFLRILRTTLVNRELRLMLALALLATATLLFIMFRNLYAVILPLLVVLIGVAFSMGITVLLGFKITMLIGLIPALIVIIGIPNCVYLINKYHSEFVKHGNKIMAVTRVIEKIGYVTLFTNLTTAIGFGVFAFTSNKILAEFGTVSGLVILATFFISLIIIPLAYSFLPNPSIRQTRHLDLKFLNKLIEKFDFWAKNKRRRIYLVASVILLISIYGMSQLRAIGFIFDDVPKNTEDYKDFQFFQDEFHGVMPFEILVDTKKKGKATKISTLKKIAQVQDTLATYDIFSKSMSLVNGVKFANQAFYNGNPKKYLLPNSLEKNFIFSYLGKTKDANRVNASFVDSNKQVARISTQIADIGSHKLPELINDLQPKLESILDTASYNISFTGTSVLVMHGYNFLIHSLTTSIGISFAVIAFLMGFLFRSFRMVMISLIPNIIPLVVTAGIMGLFGIALKPSTVLIFSIAFGISVDDTIHFLAKYKQELARHNWNISKTVSMSLKETGFSMIYTSVILFFGFIVFAASTFDSTQSLGILSSITLIVAMFTNLILLPALLLSFEKYVNRKALKDTINEELEEQEAFVLDKVE